MPVSKKGPSALPDPQMKVYLNIRYAMMHSPRWDKLTNTQQNILEMLASKCASVLCGEKINLWADLSKGAD